MIISLKMFGPLADGVDPDRAQQVAASDPGRHYSLHIEIKMDSCFAENCWLFARGVDLDWAQRVAASDLGGHCSLYPNMKIKLDGHFAENCWFPADGVGPD